MNKLIKLDHTIFLLIKQIKNLNYGDNPSFMSFIYAGSMQCKYFEGNQGEMESYVYGIVRMHFMKNLQREKHSKDSPYQEKDSRRLEF